MGVLKKLAGTTNSSFLTGLSTTPDASAAIQADSITKGLLPPRMTTGQRTGIGSPATGLIVYDISLNAYFYYNGAAWVRLTSGTATAGLIQTAYNEITVNTTTTSIAYVPFLSQSITTNGSSRVVVTFSASASATVKDFYISFRLKEDTVVVKGSQARIVDNGISAAFSIVDRTGVLSAASHTFLVEWLVENAGTTGQVRPVAAPDTEHASLLLEEVIV
ncbi:MAG: hypothetical protein ACYTEQ_12210 [Planctomycetota bacterium]|jgi:hypothetical protein